jgi:hypothetical protein
MIASEPDEARRRDKPTCLRPRSMCTSVQRRSTDNAHTASSRGSGGYDWLVAGISATCLMLHSKISKVVCVWHVKVPALSAMPLSAIHSLFQAPDAPNSGFNLIVSSLALRLEKFMRPH